MTNFIFFHGIAVNLENVSTALIQPQLDDPDHAWLYISTRHDAVRHALPVNYETANAEWRALWDDITTDKPTFNVSCGCKDGVSAATANALKRAAGMVKP